MALRLETGTDIRAAVTDHRNELKAQAFILTEKSRLQKNIDDLLEVLQETQVQGGPKVKGGSLRVASHKWAAKKG